MNSPTEHSRPDPAERETALAVAIAGVTTTLTTPGPAWRDALADRYAAFLTDAPGRWRFRVIHDVSLTAATGTWITHAGPLTRFQIGALAGQIDLVAQTVEVAMPAVQHVVSAADRGLSYLLMQTLPRERAGLLLHGVGLEWAGGGHLFFGPSGAGKTTLATLAAGQGQVLSDENLVVTTGPDGPTLFSTPFWGHSTPPALIHRTNRRVPLRAAYQLVHAADFSLVRLTPAEAATALLTTEKVATERVESAAAWLAIAERLIGQVPIYRLAFRPTPEVWPFLRHAFAR